MNNRSPDQENKGFHDHIMDQIIDRACDPHRGKRRKARQNQPYPHHYCIGNDSFYIPISHRPHGPQHHGSCSQNPDEQVGHAWIVVKDQREQANDGIDSHLGQQSRKYSGNSGRRCTVRTWQPKEKKQPRF